MINNKVNNAFYVMRDAYKVIKQKMKRGEEKDKNELIDVFA